MAKFDFNLFEDLATALMSKGEFRQAMRIYYFMADGDSSLDGGYLGYKLGLCSENLGEVEAARYWYNRAREENPTIIEYLAACQRLGTVEPDNIYNHILSKK